MADRLYLDETGLRLYDAKLKTYITDQMDKTLEEVMENFSQGMKIMGTIEPKSDEIEMALTISSPSVGHTYIFKIDMSKYKDGVTIKYYDGDGDLVAETARNNDTITCIKDAVNNPSGTSPDGDQPARWALLAGNWDFDAPDSTPVLDLGALPPGETKKHISLGVLNGTDLGFDVPTATEVAQQIGTALTEGGFVKVDKEGGTYHTNATNTISTTEPDGKMVATDKAVYKFVHTSAETLNPANGGTTININGDLNISSFCNPSNWYATTAVAETVTNAPWGDKKTGAPAFVLRALKLSDSMTERTIVAEDGMRYVQKVTTTGGNKTYGKWQAVTLEGVTGIGVEPYDDTVGLNLYTAGNSTPNEIEIAPATQATAGVMSADDKKKLDKTSDEHQLFLWNATKTIGQVKQKIVEWSIDTFGYTNATALVNGDIISTWDEPDETLVPDGIVYKISKVGYSYNVNDCGLLISTYRTKEHFFCNIIHGEIGSLERIAVSDDILSATSQNNGVKVQLGGTLGAPTVTVTNEFGNVDVSNSSKSVSGREVAMSVPLLKWYNGLTIAKNSDLQTYDFCVVGTYMCPAEAVAKTLKNCPSTTIFAMHVTQALQYSDITVLYASVTRRIVDYNGEEWIQTVKHPTTDGVIFGEWKKVLRNDNYFTPYSSGSAGVGGAVKAPTTADENKKFLRGDGTWGREADATNTASGLMSAADKVYLDNAITAEDYYGEDIGMEEDLYGYGVEFDTGVSSPTCTRIGNMEMHRRLPVHSQMRGCLLNDQGIVQEYLPAGSWKSSKRDGSIGQVMVEIPEHYRKFVTNGTKRQVWYSTEKISGYHKVPKMYISAYEATVQRSTGKLCSVVNTTADYRGGNNNSAYDNAENSLLGTSATSISRTNFRMYARNRNVSTTNWNIMTYDAHKSLYWLFVVEYATLNSQLAFEAKPTSDGFKQGGLGAGVTNINSEKWNTFNGYYPFIKCGYTDSLGNGTGIVEYTTPANLGGITVQVPRYRGIENPFGHIFKWVDGINIQINPDGADGSAGLSKIYTCSDPDKFTDSGYTDYTYVGNEARSEGYVKEVVFGDQGEIMPSSVEGGSTTYFCDYHYTNIPATTTLRGVLFGGSANLGSAAGFVSAYSANAPSYTAAGIGSRLCFIPS